MTENEKDFNKALLRVIKVLVVCIIVLFILALLASCRHVEYVTVEKVRTDTKYITKWQKDSVWLHDSIHIKERGDTVTIERLHTQWRDRLRVDTIYQATHDTIPQPYPIETVKLVPRERSKVEWGLIVVGILSLMILILYVANKIRRFLP